MHCQLNQEQKSHVMLKSICQKALIPICSKAESEVTAYVAFLMQNMPGHGCLQPAALLKGSVEEDPAESAATHVWSTVNK